MLRGASSIKHLGYPGVREDWFQGGGMGSAVTRTVQKLLLDAGQSAVGTEQLCWCFRFGKLWLSCLGFCRQGYKALRGDHLFTSKVSSIRCFVEYFPFSDGTAESCSKAKYIYILCLFYVFSGLVWGFFSSLRIVSYVYKRIIDIYCVQACY